VCLCDKILREENAKTRAGLRNRRARIQSSSPALKDQLLNLGNLPSRVTVVTHRAIIFDIVYVLRPYIADKFLSA